MRLAFCARKRERRCKSWLDFRLFSICEHQRDRAPEDGSPPLRAWSKSWGWSRTRADVWDKDRVIPDKKWSYSDANYYSLAYATSRLRGGHWNHS